MLHLFKMAAETVPGRCCCFDPDKRLIYPFGLQGGEHVLACVPWPVYDSLYVAYILLVPWCGLVRSPTQNYGNCTTNVGESTRREY